MSIKVSEGFIALAVALNKAVEIFTSHIEKRFEDVITNALRPVAEAASLSRIVIYRVLSGGADRRFGQVYLWDKNGGGLISLDEELKILPDIPVLRNWIETLSRGESVNIHAGAMTEGESVFAGIYGIKSMLLLPVFVHGELWGGVTFQDHVGDRDIGREDVADLLRSAAHLYVSAIIRDESRRYSVEALAMSEYRAKLTDTLNKAAIVFLSQDKNNFESTMTEGVGLIADMAGLDRISVWRNLPGPDCLHTSQIYRWDRNSGGTTDITPEMKDVTYARLAPRWETLLMSGATVNSPVRLLPEAGMLNSFGVVSAYVQPVFINNAFWGFVLFEDRREERYFSGDIAEMMRSAAFLCANTVIRDETARIIAETEEFNRSILESSPVGFTIAYADEKLHVLDCSDSVWRNFKTTKRYYIEHFDAFSPEYQPDGANSMEKAARHVKRALNGEQVVDEWLHVTAEGEPFPCEITIRLVKYNGKDVVLVYMYDMRNTKELMERLKEALRAATAASDAKSEFLSKMSHEMRTPLNAIIGMTGIGKKAENAERKNYALDKIGDASTHLLGVINDVLDMSKIEANKLELSPVEFNIKHMLQKIITVINFRVDEKQQNFTVNVSEDVPRYIVGDDQRLSQVIINLLSNAVKFTQERGHIGLSVCLNGERDGVCELCFEVSDDGIGISPEQRAKLFSAFGQAESGISRKYGGTGLGLVISKRIVELMGGEIWMESEFGNGAKFFFTIKAPVGVKNRQTPGAPGVKHGGRDAGFNMAGEFAGKKMLLAEDVEINREIVTSLLEDTGLTIDCAENGAEALKIIKSAPGKYDVVFMDLQMPEMDGLEATRRVRSTPGDYYKNLPIIAMTANVFKDDIDKCLAAGMDDHLGKPLDMEMVINKLRKYLLSLKN